MAEKKVLVEKWTELIDTDKAPAVQSKETMAQLLENQEESMNESSVAADIAQYTPILIPAVRRIFPNLLANELVGVQAMKQPTGYAYALRYVYGGNGATDHSDETPGLHRGQWDAQQNGVNGRQLNDAPVKFRTVALIMADPTVNFLANGVYAIGSSSATAAHGELGKGLFVFATAAEAAAAVTPGTTATGESAATTSVVAGFQNEAGYSAIFKGFIHPMLTSTGEYSLGAGGEMAAKTLNLKIERTQVEAQTRKLKAEYTLEMAQDLKNIHGLDAEKELINIMEYEIGAELDRELVDLINTKATVTPTWTYGGAGVYSGPLSAGSPLPADGRWEAEKIRTLYNRLLREANQIALTTRRGSANFIIASSNVVAALETLQGFMYASVPGAVKPVLGVAKVGTLDGRFAVYMDTFAYQDYITVGYKGANVYDSGIIYCPYVPLQMQKVVDPDTFQPKIGFMTRDAIAGNLYGVQNYYRKFTVDFTGSSFGGGYFNTDVGYTYQPW